MKRRNFIKSGLVATAALPFYSHIDTVSAKAGEQPFKMKFSPEFGIFADLAGTDPID